MFSQALSAGITNLVLFGVIVLFRRLVHREDLRSFLFRWDKTGVRQLIEGALLGFGLIFVYALLVIVLGAGRLTTNLSAMGRSVSIFFALIAANLCVSVFEEGLFRGYVLPQLMRKLPTAAAIIAPASLFGLLHYFDYRWSGAAVWPGVLNAAMIAVVLSIVVIRSGSIMLPLGFHALWNATQNLILNPRGITGHLGILLHIDEDAIAGTAFVPEGGLAVTITILLFLIYILYRFRDTKAAHTPTA